MSVTRNIDRWVGAVETPAFVWEQHTIARMLTRIRGMIPSGTTVLYAMKALPPVVESLRDRIDGYSVSSVFEARYVRKLGCAESLVQYVSPIVRHGEITDVIDLCDRISLNSLGQLDRYGKCVAEAIDVGIRVNPGLTFAKDARFNPCRRNSKLGVPLARFVQALRANPSRGSCVSGLHFHSNFASDDLNQLVATINRIESELGEDLHRFQWLNVGGGYTFASELGVDQLMETFCRLSDRYQLEIVIEPGAAIVRSAGHFVATVEDMIDCEDNPIVILDLTVNHWPEVFEYQFEPDVDGHVDGGQYTYLLAGSSCVAGDLFGVYSFDVPLEIGSRIVFRNAGAYSIVKANFFNGINLPNIYVHTETDQCVLLRRFTYEDFASRFGEAPGVI